MTIVLSFDPDLPVGSASIFVEEGDVISTILRVPGDWVLRTIVWEPGRDVATVAQTFVPLPADTGRG